MSNMSEYMYCPNDVSVGSSKKPVCYNSFFVINISGLLINQKWNIELT